MARAVLKYGDEALRRKAVRVAKIDAGIRRLASELLEAMYASKGVGLAAEQIGRTEAVCVIDVSPPQGKAVPAEEPPDDGIGPMPEMPMVMVNPVIRRAAGEQVGDEGCLSFPEIYVSIRRAAEVDVSYTNLDGKNVEVRVRGLLARAVQHELDHLGGVLLVDRMSPVQKIALAGRLRRLKARSAE